MSINISPGVHFSVNWLINLKPGLKPLGKLENKMNYWKLYRKLSIKLMFCFACATTITLLNEASRRPSLMIDGVRTGRARDPLKLAS